MPSGLVAYSERRPTASRAACLARASARSGDGSASERRATEAAAASRRRWRDFMAVTLGGAGRRDVAQQRVVGIEVVDVLGGHEMMPYEQRGGGLAGGGEFHGRA